MTTEIRALPEKPLTTDAPTARPRPRNPPLLIIAVVVVALALALLV